MKTLSLSNFGLAAWLCIITIFILWNELIPHDVVAKSLRVVSEDGHDLVFIGPLGRDSVLIQYDVRGRARAQIRSTENGAEIAVGLEDVPHVTMNSDASKNSIDIYNSHGVQYFTTQVNEQRTVMAQGDPDSTFAIVETNKEFARLTLKFRRKGLLENAGSEAVRFDVRATEIGVELTDRIKNADGSNPR